MIENNNFTGQFEKCSDTSDCIELSFMSGLYLKPIALLKISVTVPTLKSGQTISNNEVMEKLKVAIRPEKFTSIKVSKATLEFLRFDAEIENRQKLEFILGKVDQKGIKLGSLSDVLQIRAMEARTNAPTRNDWDSYFKEAKHMNEKKPGERPDTVHIKDLPCAWFLHYDDPHGDQPSEHVVTKVFETYGDIRAIDIPMLDSYRSMMTPSISGVNKFVSQKNHLFEAFIQYKEYVGFVKCMTALQSKKLVLQKDNVANFAQIKVDFDKTKHMSDITIKKREVEREKLMMKDRRLLGKDKISKGIDAMKRDAALMAKFNSEEKKRKKLEEKEEKRKAKERKKKEKELSKRMKKILHKHKDLKGVDDVEDKLRKKIDEEERTLLFAQRKLEATRLFDKIFDRIKVYQLKQDIIKAAQPNSNKTLADHTTGWFERRCEKVSQKRKTIIEKYAGFKSKEMNFLYEECTRKLNTIVHDQKKKYLKSCTKMAATNGMDIKRQDEKRKKAIVSYKRIIKAHKNCYINKFEHQSKRLDKLLRGKIQVIFLPIDDDNKVSLSPATGSSSSSDSDSSLDSSESEKELPGNLKSDQTIETNEGPPNQPFFENYVPFFQNNYRGRGNMNQGQYQQDFRGGRGRFHRPFFNRGPRGFDHHRGRGMNFRGRFQNRGRGDYNNYSYKKNFNHPIQEGDEKWFNRKFGDEDNYDRSVSRSRSRSRHRSKPRRSRSYSSRSRSRSRSPSRSKRRSRSYTSRSRSRSKSRTRRSPSRSRSRSRSRDRKYRNSFKGSEFKNNGASHYSDVELSSGDEYQRNYEVNYDRGGYFNHFRGRGRRPFFHRGNQRTRMPRGHWRGGRGRGSYNKNYDNKQHDEPYDDEYVHMYKKYFNRVTEKDSYRRKGYNSDYESEDEFGRVKNRRRESFPDSDGEMGKRRSRRYSNSSVEIYPKKRNRSGSRSSSEPEMVIRRKHSSSPRRKKSFESYKKVSPKKYSDSDEIDVNKQREKDLRERLSKKLQAKKSLGNNSEHKKLKSKTPETKKLNESKNSVDSNKVTTSLKKRLSNVLQKEDSGQVSDNTRYREEEERQRMNKLGHKPKGMKRQIRKRQLESDDSLQELSASDDNYGPSPPKHFSKKIRS